MSISHLIQAANPAMEAWIFDCSVLYQGAPFKEGFAIFYNKRSCQDIISYHTADFNNVGFSLLDTVIRF